MVKSGRYRGRRAKITRRGLVAGRARQLLDDGLPLAAACRVVVLEDRLAAANRRIRDLGGEPEPDDGTEIPLQTMPDIATPSYYRTS